MSKEMSEEAFNEIVDGFEYIRTLTEWGSKNIKQHIQRLQQENKHQKEVIDKLKDKTKENIKNAKYEITTLTIGDKAYYQYIEKMLDNYVDILKEVSK